MDLKPIKELLLFPRPSNKYLAGVDGFLEFAYMGKSTDDKIRCPCVKCVNSLLLKRQEVYDHLVCHGISDGYTVWGCHGETAAYISSNKHGKTAQYISTKKRSRSQCESTKSNMRQLVEDVFREPPVTESETQNRSEPGPDPESQAYYDLVRDADEPLWPECELSRLSLFVILFHIKATNKWSNKSLNDLLPVLQKAIPNGKNLPSTFCEAKKIVGKLGLNYVRIHACEKNCQLYRKEKAGDDFCSKCGISRWKNVPDKTTLTKKERRKAIPRKVLRYFPIKPRLKRLFMHKDTATALRWHDEERIKDGALRHPADSKAWEAIDSKYKRIAADSRNIRFGMATDGFNPYGTMSTKHSCWPVVLVPYNLPPWLCMKPSSLLLTLIIPGPSYPGKNFHVFMEPVYEELAELFEVGTFTYDASQDEMFQLYAVVLWTVSDYPGLAIASGHSTSSESGCFPCSDETFSIRLKNGQKYCFMGHRRFLHPDHEFRYDAESFDGTEEHRVGPTAYSQVQVLEKIKSIKDFDDSKTWKFVSGLFSYLPYWDFNLLRHNLDIMHIEKNVCENIYGTLLGIEGKSKDNLKARLDLQDMEIREELHPKKKPNGKYFLPAASYTMSRKQAQQFCKVLHGLRVSNGYSGNISRCANVSQGRISGLKSHDCHILMQQLLPLALRGLLPDNVTSVLFDLCAYFREVSAKVLYVSELEKLEQRIKITLCRMEMIFPPGFFTVMVHLVIHLAAEAKIGGPVSYRSMWFLERYLGKVKSNVRNKAHPEGSIAEAYLADECMTFCSRYIVGFETKYNMSSRDEDNELVGHPGVKEGSTLFPDDGKPLGKPRNYVIRGLAKVQAHRYLLFNCSDVNPYLRVHADEITNRRTINPSTFEKIQNETFHEWFRSHIMKLEMENNISNIKNDIRWLARGPVDAAKSYRGFISRGMRFRPKRLDRMTQNSGVMVTAKTSTYARAGDANPVLDDVTYYGRIIDIIELNYSGQFPVVLFKCEWIDVFSENGIQKDKYGYTVVNFSHLIHSGDNIEHEPFIFPNQAEQVFYVDDETKPGWSVVMKPPKPRSLYDTGNEEYAEDTEPFHVSHLAKMFKNKRHDKHWVRTDIEGTEVDDNTNAPSNEEL